MRTATLSRFINEVVLSHTQNQTAVATCVHPAASCGTQPRRVPTRIRSTCRQTAHNNGFVDNVVPTTCEYKDADHSRSTPTQTRCPRTYEPNRLQSRPNHAPSQAKHDMRDRTSADWDRSPMSGVLSHMHFNERNVLRFRQRTNRVQPADAPVAAHPWRAVSRASSSDTRCTPPVQQCTASTSGLADWRSMHAPGTPSRSFPTALNASPVQCGAGTTKAPGVTPGSLASTHVSRSLRVVLNRRCPHQGRRRCRNRYPHQRGHHWRCPPTVSRRSQRIPARSRLPARSPCRYQLADRRKPPQRRR